MMRRHSSCRRIGGPSCSTIFSSQPRPLTITAKWTAYGDLFRVAPSGVTATNYLGLGGRVGFNTGQYMALEAELNYDFEQNYTNITVIGSNRHRPPRRPTLPAFGRSPASSAPNFSSEAPARSASSLRPRADLSTSPPIATRLPARHRVLPLPLLRSEDLRRTSRPSLAAASRPSSEPARIPRRCGRRNLGQQRRL